MMPEWLWGVAFLLQGMVMLDSIIYEVYTPRRLWIESFFGMCLWLVAINSCYLAYWTGWENIAQYRPPAIMGMEWIGMWMSVLVFIRYDEGKNG